MEFKKNFFVEEGDVYMIIPGSEKKIRFEVGVMLTERI